MRDFLYGPFLSGRAAASLFALRVVAGSALILHGLPKTQHLTSWMPSGSPVPGFVQALSPIAEVGGGLGLILGLLTPIAAFGIFCNMVAALSLVHIPHGDPFVSARPAAPSMEP